MTRRKNKSGVTQDASTSDPFRHLGDHLAGVIFGCTNGTYDECVNGLVFGLPQTHLSYVKGIKIGMPLFLFNYSRRELHGVFAAVSLGQLDIKPHGWTGGKPVRTSYPAQVKVRVHKKGTALKEHQFKPVMRGNYDTDGPLFQFELDSGQVMQLCRLFKSSVPEIKKTKSTSLLEAPRVAKPPPGTYVLKSTRVRNESSALDSGSKSDAGSRTSDKGSLEPVRSLDETDTDSTDDDGSVVFGNLPPGIRQSLKQRSKSREQTQSDDSGPMHDGASVKGGGRPMSGIGGRSHLDPRASECSFTGSSGKVYPVPRRRTLAEANGLVENSPADRSQSPIEPKHANAVEAESQGLMDPGFPVECTLTEFLVSKESELQFAPHEALDTLVLVGGVDEASCFSHMEVLQEDGRTWEEMFLVPGFNFIDGQAVSIKDSVFLLGGGTDVYAQCRAMMVMKSGWKKWKAVTPMPVSRAHFAAVSVDDAVYTLAGGAAYQEEDICHRYDCDSDSWMRGPVLKQKRYGHAACAQDSLILASGGGACGHVLNSVEMLDLRTGSWLSLPSMTTARKHHRCIAFEERFWAIGGVDSNGAFSRSVEVYDPRNQAWYEMPSVICPRAFFTVEVIQNRLHVIGGASSPSEYRFLGSETFDWETQVWNSGPSVGGSGKRGHHSSCVIAAHH